MRIDAATQECATKLFFWSCEIFLLPFVFKFSMAQQQTKKHKIFFPGTPACITLAEQELEDCSDSSEDWRPPPNPRPYPKKPYDPNANPNTNRGSNPDMQHELRKYSILRRPPPAFPNVPLHSSGTSTNSSTANARAVSCQSITSGSPASTQTQDCIDLTEISPSPSVIPVCSCCGPVTVKNKWTRDATRLWKKNQDKRELKFTANEGESVTMPNFKSYIYNYLKEQSTE